MMPLALLALLVCFSTASLAAQAPKAPVAKKAPAPAPPKLEIPERPTEEHPGHVMTEFDRRKNRTVISLDNVPVGSGLTLGARFGIKGNRPTGRSDDGMVTLILQRQGESYEYQGCSIKLTADGAPFPVGIPTHEGSGNAAGDVYMYEYVSVFLPVNRVLQLAKAKTVEGKLCRADFALGEPELVALRDFLSRMQD